jgi:hypothetical protein
MTLPPGSFDGLPPLMCEIAEVAGIRAAIDLAEARGGNRVYFPTPGQLSEEHWLVKIVGRDAALKICKHFSPGHHVELELPRGPTGSRADLWRRLARLIKEGAPSGVITRRLGISRRTVVRHRSAYVSATSGRRICSHGLRKSRRFSRLTLDDPAVVEEWI